MENLGFYAMYVVEGIFVLLLLFGGIFPYKFPMKYQMALDYIAPDGKYFTTMFRYPHYSSKRALSSKENWEFAQKIYGKYLLLFAGVQVVIGVFWYPIAEFAMEVTKWDDAGMVVITCPIIVFIILANVLTEVALKNCRRFVMSKYDEFGRPIYETAEEYNKAHKRGNSSRTYDSPDGDAYIHKQMKTTYHTQRMARKNASGKGKRKSKLLIIVIAIYFIAMIVFLMFNIVRRSDDVIFERIPEEVIIDVEDEYGEQLGNDTTPLPDEKE